MIKYTDEQLEGISLRGHDMLISAAAGSGKTRVLVDRIVDMIVKDGVSLKNVLVVTFTRAAAGEMKARLESALYEAMMTFPEKKAFIEKELYHMPEGYISTMHAFCIELLREYFYLLDISPKFNLLATSEEAMLKNEALNDILDEAYLQGDEAFLDFVNAYGGNRTDKKVITMVLLLANFLSGVVRPSDWLKEAVATYKEETEKDSFFKLFDSLLDNSFQRLEETFSVMERLLMNIPEDDAKVGYLACLIDDKDHVRRLKAYAKEDYQAFFDYLEHLSFTRMPAVKKAYKELYQEQYDYFKVLRDKEVKKEIEGLKKITEKLNLLRIKEDREKLYPYLVTLTALTKAYLARYMVLKQEENVLDFNDVEHLMLDLLANEQARASIKESIQYIFFDEYQDANPVQEAIVELLSGENNLFFVGDVKQAIYRFRLSDPSLFNHRYERYQRDANDGRLIFLSKNFRSDPSILAFANFIFSNLMTKDLGEVDYQAPGQALIPGRGDTELSERITLHLVEPIEDSDYDEEVLEISKTIKQLIKEGYQYKDIAILLRSPRARLKDFEDVFKQAEIPYFTDNSTVSFENMEVNLFIEVLKCLDNTTLDESLLATMLSPFGGFNEEELAHIRISWPDGSFYEALLRYALEDELTKKIKAFKAKLFSWQKAFYDLPLSEAGYFLLEDSGYGAYLLALTNGIDRYENVKAFLYLMEEYQGFSALGLTGFLHYADTLIKEKADTLSPAVSLSEVDNCVRIMSIHKSKGLEFPIVFLADTAKTFNFRDSAAPLLLDNQFGMAMNVVDLDTRSYHKSFEKRLLAIYQNALTKSEEVRLLYVALTRPIKALHWFGKVKNKEKALEAVLAKSFKSGLYQANSYLDWLLLILSQDALGDALFDELRLQKKADFFFGKKIMTLAANSARLDFSKEEEKEPIETVDVDLEKELSQKLYFAYPYQEDTNKPAKQTVSDLKKDNDRSTDAGLHLKAYTKLREVSERFKRPSFLQDEATLSQAERGTLLHKVMSLLPLEQMSLGELNLALDKLVAKYFLTEEERKSLPLENIIAFFESELGKRVIEADKKGLLKREASFTMLYEGTGVDGQIDMFFFEGESMILIDFKTDKIINPLFYEKQMTLYKLALEEAYQKPVKEVYLYWIRHNQSSRL